MKTLLLVKILWLLSPSNSYSYPTTIAKGYKTCATCHLTASGGTTLKGYGRAMSNDFMSSLSPGKPKELLFMDLKHFEVGGDYRYLALHNEELPEPLSLHPMVLDAELSYKWRDRLDIMASMGLYGEDQTLESRENFLQLALLQNATVRVGYFMPLFGINTNDHSLQIKRMAGLSRGSESYNLELWYLNKWVQVFFTASIDTFALTEENSYNFYRLRTPPYKETFRTRLSLFRIPRTEVGINYLFNNDFCVEGVFLKTSPIKNLYVLGELDTDREAYASYLRVGYFLFKGVDLFAELDQNNRNEIIRSAQYVGVDWMIAPRVELSFKFNFGDGPDQYQSHFWY